MIEHAVARGLACSTPDTTAGCAQLYAETARKMVSYGDQMPAQVMASLTTRYSTLSTKAVQPNGPGHCDVGLIELTSRWVRPRSSS